MVIVDARSSEFSHPALRVLVVEDDFLIRSCLKEYLEEHGIEVLEAETCAQASDILQSKAAIDVAVTDMSLPDGDGVTLERSFRLYRPELPLVVTTGDRHSASTLASSHHVISKPYGLSSVLAAVRDVTS